MSYDSAYRGAFDGAIAYYKQEKAWERYFENLEMISRVQLRERDMACMYQWDLKQLPLDFYEKHKHELKNISVDKMFDYLSEYMRYFIDKIIGHNHVLDFEVWLVQKIFDPELIHTVPREYLSHIWSDKMVEIQPPFYEVPYYDFSK